MLGKNRIVLVALLITAAIPFTHAAEPKPDNTNCANITDSTKRLACFDKAAEVKVDGKSTSTTSGFSCKFKCHVGTVRVAPNGRTIFYRSAFMASGNFQEKDILNYNNPGKIDTRTTLEEFLNQRANDACYDLFKKNYSKLPDIDNEHKISFILPDETKGQYFTYRDTDDTEKETPVHSQFTFYRALTKIMKVNQNKGSPEISNFKAETFSLGKLCIDQNEKLGLANAL